MYAHCYRSGEIEVSRKADLDGAICIAKMPAKELREKLSVQARHAYDGVTLLVPGIPEADTDEAAEQAMLEFRNRMGYNQ